MAVYRGYDQAALDAQYNLRARHPACLGMFAGWLERSEAAKAARGCRAGLVYDERSGESLDLFLPDPLPAGGAPVVMFVHGGYWQALDKEHFGYPAPLFLDRGIAWASIDYTLAPRAGMDEIVRQARAAVLWLHRAGPGLGLDPSRIVVAGHSAGGHLAAMLAATDWAATERAALGVGEVSDRPALAGACAISGLYDLEPIRLCYLNAALGLDAAAARRNSPLHLSPDAAPPLVCSVGGDETDEFLSQQQAFVEVWRTRGLAIEVAPMPGRDHFTIMEAISEPATALFQAVAGLANR